MSTDNPVNEPPPLVVFHEEHVRLPPVSDNTLVFFDEGRQQVGSEVSNFSSMPHAAVQDGSEQDNYPTTVICRLIRLFERLESAGVSCTQRRP